MHLQMLLDGRRVILRYLPILPRLRHQPADSWHGDPPRGMDAHCILPIHDDTLYPTRGRAPRSRTMDLLDPTVDDELAGHELAPCPTVVRGLPSSSGDSDAQAPIMYNSPHSFRVDIAHFPMQLSFVSHRFAVSHSDPPRAVCGTFVSLI